MNKIQIIHSFTLQKSGCTTHSLLVAKLKFMEDFEGLREPIKFRPAPRPAPLFKPTPLFLLTCFCRLLYDLIKFCNPT